MSLRRQDQAEFGNDKQTFRQRFDLQPDTAYACANGGGPVNAVTPSTFATVASNAQPSDNGSVAKTS